MSAVDALSALLPREAVEAEEHPALALGRPPEAVVRPSTTSEVATLLTWASREGVGVLPISSGRRADPVGRDGRYVALSTDRLSGIEEYEAADLTITAGAGTRVATIADVLGEQGQWAPFDPPHASGRSLGGLCAAGESGPLRTGYGDLRHHVLGMTVVTGDGRELDLGGRVVKNVAGYDVLKAVVGSRGTLAVITSACLRAFPRPATDRLLAREGASLGELLETALRVGTAPILPASCVLVDRLDDAGGRAALVVRLHGARATVDAEQSRLEEHVGVSLQTLGDAGVDADDEAPGDEAVGPGAAAERRADGEPGIGRVLTALADHASDHPVVIRASALPSRLGGVLDALERLEPSAVAVDAYSGLLRAGLDGAALESLTDARRSIEALGGAVRVSVLAAAGRDLLGAGSTPFEGEAALVDRLRVAFDPEGVLWPARR